MANTKPNQVMTHPTTGELYIRFPYAPEIVRFINERLPQCTYIEGTPDSAPRGDGYPTPVSAKPMLYRLTASPATSPAVIALIRTHGFSASTRAKETLRGLQAQYRRLTGQDATTTINGTPSLGALLAAIPSEAQAGAPSSPASLASPASPTPAATHRPDITGLPGRHPLTAGQITSLKIQTPRTGERDEAARDLNGQVAPVVYQRDSDPYATLYDTLMQYPGASWVKGKKGQHRGYYRVPVTHDTPAMIKMLGTRYGLRLSPDLPRAIAERLGQLNRDLKLSQTSEADLKLPAPPGLDYLPYQKAGIAYAARKGNALIADEPGLGKTIQAIGTSNLIPQARRILIIVPASLKINWQREWQKWCTKGLRVDRVSGGRPENWPTPTDGQGNAIEPEVVVINFDLIEQHHHKLTEKPWDIMIVDEAHALKNGDAKRTKAILGHGSGKNHVPGIPTRRTLLLTGTPIMNRPAEIWTLAHALDPDFFASKHAFEKRYCDGHKTDYGWSARGSSNLQELQRELRARIMVRRRKSKVLKDLPPKTRQLIELDHPVLAKANDHYAKLEQASQTLKDCFERREALKDEAERIKAMTPDDPATKAAQTQYKQAASQLARESKVAFFQMSEIRKETALLKVPQVTDLIKTTLENGKLILFCHHSEVADAYRDALNSHFKRQAGKKGTPKTVAMVTGKTPNDQRQLEADRFQQDPDCQVFIGSIQAAGTGLTLTKASTVLFAELDWVPGNVSQAEDRAHRIGQQDHVLVYHAVIEGTLDSLMVRRLIEKQEVIDSALDDHAPTQPQTQAISKTDEERLGDWLVEMAIRQATQEEVAEEVAEDIAEKVSKTPGERDPSISRTAPDSAGPIDLSDLIMQDDPDPRDTTSTPVHP